MRKEEAAEAERTAKAERAPDKEKLIKWVESFNQTNNPAPRLKGKQFCMILAEGMEALEIMLQEIMKKTEAF